MILTESGQEQQQILGKSWKQSTVPDTVSDSGCTQETDRLTDTEQRTLKRKGKGMAEKLQASSSAQALRTQTLKQLT